MDDLISRKMVLALPRNKVRSLRTQEVVEETINVTDIEHLPSAQPEPSTEIQEILNYLDTTLHPIVSPDNWNVYAELHDMVSKLPSAQPEQAVKGCRNCKYGKYNDHWKTHFCYNPNECTEWNLWEPSAQPDNRLSKIAELVEGTIDHFDLDDAMDLLYQIKEIVGNETSNI